MIGNEDLAWWLELAPTLKWTFAKTYAESAPHSYVVLGRTAGIDKADFVRAGRVIRTFGVPGKFYSYTNIYLVDGPVKFWTMDPLVKDTDLINRAATENLYGKQDAPDTSAPWAPADAWAAGWDQVRDTSSDVKNRRIITRHFGAYAPTVLDIGCGTGALLDCGVTSPALYVGLDRSQGMLNELVMKHPHVSRVIPMDLETALRETDLAERRFDLVAVHPSIDATQASILVKGGGLLLSGDWRMSA